MSVTDPTLMDYIPANYFPVITEASGLMDLALGASFYALGKFYLIKDCLTQTETLFPPFNAKFLVECGKGAMLQGLFKEAVPCLAVAGYLAYRASVIS